MRRPSKAAQARTRRRRIVAFVVVGLIGATFALVMAQGDVNETITELGPLPLLHDDIIRQQAEEKNVPAELIAAVIYQESRFQDQTSSAGARGLMQITPDTADTIETLSGGETFVFEDLADPELNIRYGTFYLRHLLDRFEENEVAALAAYNAGPEQAEEWGGASMDEGDIEFEETRAYVDAVLERRDEYAGEYAEELGL
jgi:soluble lytic murein transglycosylase